MADTTAHAPAPDASFIWTDPAEEAVYDRTVEACLTDPRVARKLGTRPGVTADAVRTAMATGANITRALAPCTEPRAKYRAAADKLEETRSALARARADIEFDLRSTLLWVYLALLTMSATAGQFYFGDSKWVTFGAPMIGGAALGLGLAWVGSSERSEKNFGNQLTAVWGLLTLKPRALSARVELRHWENDLRQNGTAPVVFLVIEALLGDDPHSVLLPDSYEGLRALQGGGYVVPSSAARELERKLSILEGGTIAVCGPRGSGKTTLLESAVEESDFRVASHVPATYTPHDFLLSLFTDVCEEFIKREGFGVPEFTRLSGLVRGMRRLRQALRVLRRRIFFAVLAAALVVLGSFATARSLWLQYDHTVRSRAGSATDWSTRLILDVWQGRNLGAGLLITLAGLFIWQVRRSARWRRHLRTLPRTLLRILAVGLAIGTVTSLPWDAELRRRILALSDQALFVFGEAVLLLSFLVLLLTGYVMGNVRLGGRTFPARRLFSPAALCCLTGFVELFRRNDEAVALFLDRENPTRLLCLTVAALILRIASRPAKRLEPVLVTRCRDQLYHLKTVQNTSAAINPGASQIAALAGTHTSSLSTIPPKFPELVDDFRELLTHIADQIHQEGHRTVVALDELDRLGSDVQARAFLSEIKAILGVPHVYYLISVSEDVGAAFVRRGLPHRDATDSSLDDIIHVQPCDLDESRAIMDRRAPGLTPPYALLAHALSGGIPRDLIRYGRRIMEMRERTSSVELTDISRRLILEELSETLAGYRTLLAKQQWSSETASVLNTYRELVAQLRFACACHAASVTRALERFSAQSAPGTSHATPLPEDIAHLSHEASVYTYYALTLLQIFSSPAFDQRSALAEAHGPGGEPQCLAEARLELAVSSYSARSLIGDVRQAWSLPPVTTLALSATIPAPRRRPCPLHPRT
ncbi:P-loop NTPase fold protein [Streptomyces sp. NPDC058239]|uniref:P-loop NTPase fold protein n=1 Tax=unclassified Streptomyces TaxID=2593676 RepID=UPI003667B6DA